MKNINETHSPCWPFKCHSSIRPLCFHGDTHPWTGKLLLLELKATRVVPVRRKHRSQTHKYTQHTQHTQEHMYIQMSSNPLQINFSNQHVSIIVKYLHPSTIFLWYNTFLCNYIMIITCFTCMNKESRAQTGLLYFNACYYELCYYK